MPRITSSMEAVQMHSAREWIRRALYQEHVDDAGGLPPHSTQLANGWQRAVDAKNRSYYYNKRTAEKSWNPPQDASTMQRTSSTASVDPLIVDELPAGWRQAFDAKNRPYYYNKENGVRTRDRPQSSEFGTRNASASIDSFGRHGRDNPPFPVHAMEIDLQAQREKAIGTVKADWQERKQRALLSSVAGGEAVSPSRAVVSPAFAQTSSSEHQTEPQPELDRTTATRSINWGELRENAARKVRAEWNARKLKAAIAIKSDPEGTIPSLASQSSESIYAQVLAAASVANLADPVLITPNQQVNGDQGGAQLLTAPSTDDRTAITPKILEYTALL